MKTYSFEKLDVWKKAKDFSLEIYKMTKNVPKEEKFGLVSQLRRASISVSSNLAEGSSRKTPKAQFYNYSYSSALEILNQLIIAEGLGYLKKEDYSELRLELESITAMLNKLCQSTQNS